MKRRSCSIVADVGGTHVRFALMPLEDAPLQCIEVFACADFGRLEDAIQHYLSRQSFFSKYSLTALCLAIPGPIHEDEISLVNNPWRIKRIQLEYRFSCPVFLLNDFGAQAHCLSELRGDEMEWLRAPADNQHLMATKVVIGPGTGLGTAARLADGTVLETEAGHINFAPTSELQSKILTTLQQWYPVVSNELVASGPGLANIYRAMTAIAGNEQHLSPEQITTGATAGDDMCLATIAEFSKILGAVCGDLSLAYGAMGGVYLSGGVLTKLDALFNLKDFFIQFENKGRFKPYCHKIPVARITTPYPGLIGAAFFLKRSLSRDPIVLPAPIADNTELLNNEPLNNELLHERS